MTMKLGKTSEYNTIISANNNLAIQCSKIQNAFKICDAKFHENG